jgi:hypothetical protein
MGLGKIFSSIDQFLDGKKTYLFLLALAIFAFADVKDFVPTDLLAYKSEIYIGLLTGAGLSLRKAVTKGGV